MRLFQNSGLYPSYVARLDQLAWGKDDFAARRSVFLADRFGALHFLEPVLTGDPDAFFTNGDDEVLQRQWARQSGLPANTSLENVLLAQIEHHRADVFYNMDPVRYPSAFVRRLPGSVKKTLCWRAAPSGGADFSAYGAVLGNFPSILESWRKAGCRAELFFPAVDPLMAQYGHGDRQIDVLFVGGYSRHHRARARVLEEVAKLAGKVRVVFRLDSSRLTRLAESPLGTWLPLGKHRRPRTIAQIAHGPAFGLELYELLGSAKVALNGAIDMAGQDRGNMRCFEAMGCGALLLSDSGNYPEGMDPNKSILTYATPGACVEAIERALADWERMKSMADRGRRQVEDRYSKKRQWLLFNELVESI